jgi:membrane associated rhomboid family serine protease
MWVVHVIESTIGTSFHFLGVYPRKLDGLLGIFFMPFVHSGFKHLFGNSIPLLVMGTGIIFFYRSLSYKVFLIIWFASGICLWLGGRPSFHIGASGIVYGLAAFLFFSGAIRRDARLAAISLVIVFLYGGMIWGILPIWPAISWEGHLFGGISGLACAIVFRNEGPQRPIYSWEIEEEFGEDNLDDDQGPVFDDENLSLKPISSVLVP